MKTDTTSTRIYDHLTSRMDEDGVCLTSSNGIARALGIPIRTIQAALQRLDERGRIVRMGTAQYVVVDAASLDDL